MKTLLALVTGVTLLSAVPAFAQTDNSSISASGAYSTSQGGNGGEGGTGGTGTGLAYNANVFTSPGRTSARVRSAPSVVAPGLAASAVETCMGSSSAGGSGMGWGFSIGTTYNDGSCEARLDARTLFAMGQKTAALYRLCERPKMAAAFLAAGTPCPEDRARLIAQRQQVAAASRPARQGGRPSGKAYPKSYSLFGGAN